MFTFVFLSTISVDFILVDFDKILDKCIYLFGSFLENYFLLTLRVPKFFGNSCLCLPLKKIKIVSASHPSNLISLCA